MNFRLIMGILTVGLILWIASLLAGDILTHRECNPYEGECWITPSDVKFINDQNGSWTEFCDFSKPNNLSENHFSCYYLNHTQTPHLKGTKRLTSNLTCQIFKHCENPKTAWIAEIIELGIFFFFPILAFLIFLGQVIYHRCCSTEDYDSSSDHDEYQSIP